jgi:hypothetical protein
MRTARQHQSPWDPCVQPGNPHGSFSPALPPADDDRQVQRGEYRLACQLGGATSDEVIICNLPLHLADSTRTWLEHLPASQIHNWDDLVRTFVGNFQGMYVRPGNSWDLRSST